ncbi:hypothetical protein LN471_04825 [Xanthomonas campestris]|nr:hypothetical protein [Xanthomonas campestris]
MRSAITGSCLAKPITPPLPTSHRMTVTAQGWLFARALPAAGFIAYRNALQWTG